MLLVLLVLLRMFVYGLEVMVEQMVEEYAGTPQLPLPAFLADTVLDKPLLSFLCRCALSLAAPPAGYAAATAATAF